MEIQRMARGENVSFAAAAPRAGAGGSKTAEGARPAADRVELSRQWVEQMREQSRQIQALAGQSREKKSQGILDMLDGAGAGDQETDALSRQLKTQQKCLKIAMNIMKGKKIPPEDERYLMEHDPEGYKLAISMKAMVKEDKKECESVLDDEDKNGGEAEEAGESGEAAPAEGASGDGGGECVE